VYHLQREAERVTHTELVGLLREALADKEALRRRHELGARAVGRYDSNNAYQYIIAREDVHLAWLRDALLAEGGDLPPAPPDPPMPGTEQGIILADIAEQARFVDRWGSRAVGMTHARHRLMLEQLVGECREHLRMFEHAAAGRGDLLGRRTTPSPPTGRVLGARWVG